MRLAAVIACAGLTVALDAAHAAELADPTQPPRAALVGARRAPVVTAILIAAGRRIAIVDGEAVGAGDRVGDITIESVLEDGVSYVRGGHRAVARLNDPVSRGAAP